MIPHKIINIHFIRSLCVLTVCWVIMSVCSCKKWIKVDPPKTQLADITVFDNDMTAVAAMKGVYSQMISSSGFVSGANNGIVKLTGLSGDELTNYSTTAEQVSFYTNALLPPNTIVRNSLWSEGYKYIYYVNSILEGVEKSANISDAVRKQLTGEAKFVRAFCYFYLTNLFGDVPLILRTDYQQNSQASRNTAAEVYQSIKTDLLEAKGLLASDYSFSNGERIRPNKWAASAMLARVYLYLSEWANAEAQATEIINNQQSFELLPDLDKVFLKNSKEAIWQLMPVAPGQNTSEGVVFILTAKPGNVAISDKLLGAFEVNDERKNKWISSILSGTTRYYFPFKYKVKTSTTLSEYTMILRLAEQYLIRAEARAKQSNISGAKSDINKVRSRALLPDVTATTQQEILLLIEHERQVELFTEGGHRWLDLKRTHRATDLLSTLKAPDWQATDTLYPIPQVERNNDINLSQNEGYN